MRRSIAGSMVLAAAFFLRGGSAAAAPFGGWMSPEVRLPQQLVYVADGKRNLVAVFGQRGKLLGTILGVAGAGGMFVDPSHNLWVAAANAHAVEVFPRGSTTPSQILSERGYPVDVTMCPNGIVYVSDIFGPNLSPGRIEVFPPGATMPARILQYPGQLQNRGIACNRQNDIYTTAVSNGSSGIVVAYERGRAPGRALPPSLLWPGGLRIKDDGKLIVGDVFNLTITEYTPAGASVGRAIRVGNCPIFGLSSDGRDVGCAIVSGSPPGYGAVYAFPGGQTERVYGDAFVEPYGFAFDPGQPIGG